MTRFWCPWCGSTATSARREDAVPCRRCATEFAGLFGFCSRTDMVPLAPGEVPGEPIAARKRFTFFNAETGEVIGSTKGPRKRLVALGDRDDPMCA